MFNKRGIIFTLFGLLLFGVSLFALPETALLQTDELAEVSETAGLSAQDPVIVIGNLIRIGLGVVGILLVCLVLYGGYVWMTSAGNPERVERAKKILLNAVIGIAIILLSLSITTFVMNALRDSTGASNGSNIGGSSGYAGGLGGSSGAVFSVASIVPEGQLTIRNVKVQVTFSQKIDTAAVSTDAIKVINTATGAEVEGAIEASNSKITFTPSAACPEPNEDRFCFDANTEFEVEVMGTVTNTSGKAVTCSAASPCTGTFTTGDLVDTENPFVDITLPDHNDLVPSNSLQAVSVIATDDGGISVADFAVDTTTFDSVAATGDDLTDVVIETIWDTAGLQDGSDYTIEVTVTDFAGNEDKTSVNVEAAPAYCFNGVQDADEEGLDCGGLCGACAGGACVDDSDCAGICVDGACVAQPTITSVSPNNGAVGSYVTVIGSNFGLGEGSITFTATDGGSVEAEIPLCSEGWGPVEIIVEVPEGAIDGPIALTTNDGLIDTTSDLNGATVVFDVNDVVRPNICAVNPNDGSSGSAMTVEGNGFGVTQEDSSVLFGNTEVRTYRAWEDESVEVTVPSISEGVYKITVVQDGVASNEVTYTVVEEIGDVPFISSVTPESGGSGQYVTMIGSGFGGSIGTVRFVNMETEAEVIASVDFPEACGTDYWSPDAVTVIVPEGLDLSEYEIFLTTQSGRESNRVVFTVSDQDPLPGICSIEPAVAAVGEEVTIIGDYFGNEGAVTFFNAVEAEVEDWSDEEIVVSVPEGAVTGPVNITSSSNLTSNNWNFEITAGAGFAAAGLASEYMWSFSTGVVPVVPQMVFACSAAQVSGVPNADFSADICVNAAVHGEFTMLMNESSLEESIEVVKCLNDSCGNTEPVEGDLRLVHSVNATAFDWVPTGETGRFETSTTYEVRIAETAESVDGTPMGEEVSWRFTTSSSANDCSVESVLVTPIEQTLTEAGEVTEFGALPIYGDCQVLNTDSYSWSWSTNYSIASLAEGCEDGSLDSCATVTALAEGSGDVVATVNAGVSGSADLVVNFTDPYVTSYWPNCSVACVNADVGALFNTTLNPATVEVAGAVRLYECDNELCLNFDNLVSEMATCVGDGDGDGCERISVEIPGNLRPNTYYRVIVSGDVKSMSGVSLTRLNYGNDYTWTFMSRDNPDECIVSRIDLDPESVEVDAIGQMQEFSAIPYGSPDACSVAGQRLDVDNYAWSWSDPIVNEPDIAEWYKINGTLIDASASTIPAGCSESCVSIGSTAYAAICGNGVIEVGEDCDDSNVSSGDGCSSTCKLEGSLACSMSCSGSGVACTSDDMCDVGQTCDASGGGCCGDGIVSGFEECDDRNLLNGDGCSAICLNEGSVPLELTCGDGIVTHYSNMGGEECDDGNKKSGDGCSSTCLNEGSVRFADIHAVCGNGIVEAPYETCDDLNSVNGDGCSSICLREGANGSYGTCGNGIVEFDPVTLAGEQCDGGEGCTDACLLAGSSLAYSSPSVCGDGVVGLGENNACEVGAGGDGRYDSTQLSVVSNTASTRVNPDTGRATTTVEVSLDALSATSSMSLLCVAETDDDCPLGYGPDENGCCSVRPEVTLHPNHDNVCLNASIYAVFTEEMDLTNFEDVAYVKVDTSTTGGACPAGHEIFRSTAALEGRSIFARAWNGVRRLLTLNAQEDGDCLLPIDGFNQYQLENGDYRVTFLHSVPLAENGEYTIVVEGDTYGDAEVDGVRTRVGVGLSGNFEQVFTAGTEICSLDFVEVEDTNSRSPHFFTSFEETHGFVARAMSLHNGVQQEIESMPGVYDWEWQDWSEDSSGSVIAVSGAGDVDAADVTSQRIDGEANVIAEAEITTDSSSGTEGSIVSGVGEVRVLLCDNPWPAHENFPFIDSPSSTLDGVTRGKGWMNFSTYYCRDQSNSVKLLPSLSVVAPRQSGSSTIVKEYLMAVGTSGDVIGIRIAANPEYLSPLAWYRDQGFDGSPSEIEVDGFDAVQDGRTVYVSAPNETGGRIYSNIYVISYNEGASQETIEIYNQILGNFSFNTNLESTRLCHNGSEYTGTVCSSDLDCNQSIGEFCASDKDKLRRDAERLSDMRDIESALASYALKNKVCSATTSQSCTTSSDCPAGESCVGTYPTLDAGTFVRSLDSSAWGSWNEELSKALGSIPSDPLNRYASCTQGGQYDAATCVNSEAGTYMCPADSHVYHYRSVGPFGYVLSAELEYASSGAGWVEDIDQNTTDEEVILVGNAPRAFGNGFVSSAAVCNGNVRGGSSICGDGVVGLNEVCEIGEKGLGASCTTADGVVGSVGTVCNSTCTGFVDDPAGACIPFACGNGVIEASEECDDGASNGKYGFCGNDCTYASGFFCGDGTLAGGEVCDCSNGVASGLNSGGAACTVANGVYTSNPNNSCAWNCAGPAAFCGDGVVSNGEQCDGNNETYSGLLCGSGDNIGMPCTSDAECTNGFCGAGAAGAVTWAEACPVTTVCLSGVSAGVNMVGMPCTSDTACGVGGICSTFDAPTTRTRTCADDGVNGQLCTWNDLTWQSVACKALGSCGNGIVDAGEQCDDGNDNPNDNCTNICTVNVCGDGFLNAGVEQCDAGSDNGLVCDSSYQSTCTYCSSSCKLLTNSGAFCGDGVRNGAEFCDAGDLPLLYYNMGSCGWQEIANGSCNPLEGVPPSTLGTCTIPGEMITAEETGRVYTCGTPGVCNGGDENGEYCTSNSSCSGGGSCVFPTCSATCGTACPFTYEADAIMMLDNQVGAVRSGTVNLLSYEDTKNNTVLGDPNSATIYFPACGIAKDLRLNISTQNRQYPDVEMMFILDRSQSMEGELDDLSEAVADATNALFDAYEGTGAVMKIGVAYIGGKHGTGSDAYSSSEYKDFVLLSPTNVRSDVIEVIDDEFDDATEADDGDLDSEIGTPVYESLKDAASVLTTSEAVDKYIVLFTDGNVYNADYGKIQPGTYYHLSDRNGNGYEASEYMAAVSGLTDDLKDDGIEIFTAVLTANTCDISQMERWSSLDCVPKVIGATCSGMQAEGNYTCTVPENGVDYSHSATTASELSDIYQDIVSAILDVTVKVVVDDVASATTVASGVNRAIELPSTFACDPLGETAGTLQLNFKGTGTVEVNSVVVDMCTP